MRRLSLAAFALSTLTAFGCGSPSSPSGTGTLNVRLTDGPFSDAEAVLVTFSEVAAHRSDSDWTKVAFADGGASRTCDLKKLEDGAEDILGTDALLAGQYTMVRLVVQSAKIYFNDASTGPACAPTMMIDAAPGTWADVQIPSGEVKLNRGFNLEADATTTIRLDFDGDRSINLTGNGTYVMNPVVAILSVTPQTATPQQPQQ